MEYICTIVRYKHDLTNFITAHFSACLRLPLLSCKPKINFYLEEGIGDFIFFFKEDRYSNSLINVYPPKEFTEEQLNIINKNGNYCVENNIYTFDFEL